MLCSHDLLPSRFFKSLGPDKLSVFVRWFVCNVVVVEMTSILLLKIARHHNDVSEQLLRRPKKKWTEQKVITIFMIYARTFQALSSKQPANLHSLLTLARQPKQFRPSLSGLFFVPRVETNIGTRVLHQLFGNHSMLVLDEIKTKTIHRHP